ncbi:hypothetical protein [Nesterenkonia natronophila]|uniref:Uncharacterized protein n=1 Tax=Nesterenkonia natronophila TaxID=2174932 RepID=A0A3A4F596_9MICC|nr:hypothetical protein [Nesterenkonia natronophila]RJN32976.1 hypothetical protein D3250_03985 [Nesterenkonia natronophila]
MREEFGHTSVTDTERGAEGPTPLEQFILNHRELLREDPNTWAPVKSQTKLLLDAAEGRRLRVQKIGSTHVISRSGVRVGGVSDGVSTLVGHQALRATVSPELTRRCLALSDVPFLSAKTLHVSQAKSAAAFLDRTKRPVSILPSAGLAHGGLAVDLRTRDQLLQAWDRTSEAVSHMPTMRQQIEVETFLPWLPLRLFVVAEEVVAAVARLPLYAIGDGNRTLDQLAEAAVKRRNASEHLEPVKDADLRDLLDILLVEGQRVLPPEQVRLLTNDRRGQMGAGWSVDITNHIGPELTDLAVSGMWSVPGLGASAVDILTPSLAPEGQAVVSGVAPAAALREFRYPAYGRSQLPNRAIMQRIAALANN